MDYTVAVDGSGQAAQALMGAAGVSGIPHAFIVGAQLMVAWMQLRCCWGSWLALPTFLVTAVLCLCWRPAAAAVPLR